MPKSQKPIRIPRPTQKMSKKTVRKKPAQRKPAYLEAQLKKKRRAARKTKRQQAMAPQGLPPRSRVAAWLPLYSEEGDFTNIILLRRDPGKNDPWEQIVGKYDIIGSSSNCGFPRKTNKPDFCQGWIHGFRRPEKFIPNNIPKAMISKSDFVDPKHVKPKGREKRYDLIYSCPDRADYRRCKNLPLFKKCLPLFRKMKLKVAMVGVTDREIADEFSDILTCYPKMSHQNFLSFVDSCRVAFIPSVIDASPRLLAECLCMDIPVVVNRQIYGGWKYINRRTGVFFKDENDVIDAVSTALCSDFEPRAWFQEFNGPINAGPRLYRFVATVVPRIRGRMKALLLNKTSARMNRKHWK